MHKKIVGIFVFSALVMLTGVAFADNTVDSNSTKKMSAQEKQDTLTEIRKEKQAEVENKKAEMQEKREESLEEKCLRIQEKVQERSGNLEDAKEKHMAVYENMTERISKFIEKLSTDGYDVAKIEADLVVLQEKIQSFSDDFAAQSSKLAETKDLACGHSDGEFKGKLIEARLAVKMSHTDAMEIRKYVQNTLRVDIQALRSQKIETVK